MRTKRIMMICIVIGLLVMLATTVYAAPTSHPSTPNLVGTWRMTVSLAEGEPETFEALHTFFADGNWVEVNEFKESNQGVWIGSGNTYLLTFEGYTFDEQSQHNGKSQVRASIKKEVKVDGIWLAHLHNGKIQEQWVYFDALGMLQQIGALPMAAPST
jgi:hypothetical protein